MPNAQIVASWQDAEHAHLAVAVDEGAGGSRVEYVGSVPIADLAGKSASQRKALLVAAVKATRDAQIAPPPTDLGIGGTVTL